MKFEKLRQIQYCNLPVPKYTSVGENYESLKLRSFIFLYYQNSQKERNYVQVFKYIYQIIFQLLITVLTQ